jgi:hypothetical protein
MNELAIHVIERLYEGVNALGFVPIMLEDPDFALAVLKIESQSVAGALAAYHHVYLCVKDTNPEDCKLVYETYMNQKTHKKHVFTQGPIKNFPIQGAMVEMMNDAKEMSEALNLVQVFGETTVGPPDDDAGSGPIDVQEFDAAEVTPPEIDPEF